MSNDLKMFFEYLNKEQHNNRRVLYFANMALRDLDEGGIALEAVNSYVNSCVVHGYQPFDILDCCHAYFEDMGGGAINEIYNRSIDEIIDHLYTGDEINTNNVYSWVMGSEVASALLTPIVSKDDIISVISLIIKFHPDFIQQSEDSLLIFGLSPERH